MFQPYHRPLRLGRAVSPDAELTVRAHALLPLASVFCASALPLTICQAFFLCPPCPLCLIWQPPFVLLFSSSSFCRYIKLTKRIAHWWDCWPVYGERDENQQNDNSTFVNIWEFTKHTHIVSFDFYKTSKNSNKKNRPTTEVVLLCPTNALTLSIRGLF